MCRDNQVVEERCRGPGSTGAQRQFGCNFDPYPDPAGVVAARTGVGYVGASNRDANARLRRVVEQLPQEAGAPDSLTEDQPSPAGACERRTELWGLPRSNGRRKGSSTSHSRWSFDWTQRQDQMTTDVCRVTRKSNQSTIAHQSNRWLVLGVPGREGRLGRNQKLSLSRKRSLSEIARLRTIFPAIKIAGFAFRSAFAEGLSTTRCITRFFRTRTSTQSQHHKCRQQRS
jgi:hypothetical protein